MYTGAYVVRDGYRSTFSFSSRSSSTTAYTCCMRWQWGTTSPSKKSTGKTQWVDNSPFTHIASTYLLTYIHLLTYLPTYLYTLIYSYLPTLTAVYFPLWTWFGTEFSFNFVSIDCWHGSQPHSRSMVLGYDEYVCLHLVLTHPSKNNFSAVAVCFTFFTPAVSFLQHQLKLLVACSQNKKCWTPAAFSAVEAGENCPPIVHPASNHDCQKFEHCLCSLWVFADGFSSYSIIVIL